MKTTEELWAALETSGAAASYAIRRNTARSFAHGPNRQHPRIAADRGTPGARIRSRNRSAATSGRASCKRISRSGAVSTCVTRKPALQAAVTRPKRGCATFKEAVEL